MTLTDAELFDGEDQVTDTHIAIGKTLTVKPASGYDGVVDTTVADTITGANVTSVTVTKPVTLSGAYTVKYSSDITCADVASGSLVVKDTKIALTVDSKYTAGQFGVFSSIGKAYATTVEADITQVAIDGAKDFVVGTKITVAANGSLVYYNQNTGKGEQIVAGKATPAVAYVISGTAVQAEGTAVTNKATVKVGNDMVTAIGGTVNGAEQVVRFEVGEKEITVTFAT